VLRHRSTGARLASRRACCAEKLCALYAYMDLKQQQQRSAAALLLVIVALLASTAHASDCWAIETDLKVIPFSLGVTPHKPQQSKAPSIIPQRCRKCCLSRCVLLCYLPVDNPLDPAVPHSSWGSRDEWRVLQRYDLRLSQHLARLAWGSALACSYCLQVEAEHSLIPALSGFQV
jgi:hypothetical protein